ncbi:MAG: DNA repair protein RecO [Mariniblastus sp.]|nr:DNA repair protein RecO [Mariniblastus sp.]
MASEKTTGIVLRVIPFSETSCIVTLFTRDFGKVTTMAKGARRPKSPFEAALDVLALCRIVFLNKNSDAMGLLTEAKLERRFRSATRSLDRLYAGYYIIELLNSLTDDGDPHPELFELSAQVIKQIDSTEITEEEVGLALLNYELKMLGILGHLPMLTKCVSCGREKTTIARVSFGLNAGGILCGACRGSESNIVSLSPEGLQFLLEIVGGQIGEQSRNSDNWNGQRQELLNVGENQNSQKELDGRDSFSGGTGQSPDPDNTELLEADATGTDADRCLKEVRRLIHKYITHLLGFQPKLYKFLGNL